nr:MAG TPA: hypothetical protein [Caudoviricetes sp.]
MALLRQMGQSRQTNLGIKPWLGAVNYCLSEE